MTLEEIIAGCQKNNIEAQSSLYKLFAPKLFAKCLKYSRNYQEAQDNLQDGFLLLFDKIKTYQNKGSFEGWAKRLMINHVLQQYRQKNFLEIVSNNIQDHNQQEIEIELETVSIDFLNQIIQELPQRYQLVFNLYAIDDFSHKEIATALNITIGTSKSNLSRARNILKQKIESQNKQTAQII